MGKIARPAFENNKVSDFQLMLEMYDLFDDPQLLPVHKIKIYRYEDETNNPAYRFFLGSWFDLSAYFGLIETTTSQKSCESG